ncbi:hypothetical protein [Novipirellula caenicola]|uniref:GAF domain-containing protein n=1 Tax=Novipirellula caenicola TaxID=1536901 RepID=A0ABP9W0J9_9BACT
MEEQFETGGTSLVTWGGGVAAAVTTGWQAWKNHKRFLRLARQFSWGREKLRQLRARAIGGPITHLHQLTHLSRRMSAISIQGAHGNLSGVEHLRAIAQQYCDETRQMVASILEDDAKDIHVCIKMIYPAPAEEDGRGGDVIATYSRSSNAGARGSIDSDAEVDQHTAGACSTWASIYGISDGKTKWQPLRCFCCPDLAAAKNQYQCTREDWQDRYASALVVPIRYASDGNADHMETIGFLAIDSSSSEGMKKLPNAFAYSQNPAAFENQLKMHPVFDAAAIAADMLGSAFSYTFETLRQTESSAATMSRAKKPSVRRLPICHETEAKTKNEVSITESTND